jgi:Mrp family chromosome partitioning ATPase
MRLRKKRPELTWDSIRTAHTQDAPAAHAYATILRKLFLDPANAERKVFLLSSALDQEGKTITALQLALALAIRDKKVLVIDAHLRSPQLGRYLGLRGSPGVIDVLAADGFADDGVVPDPDFPGLRALPRGEGQEKALDAASWERLGAFLQRARKRFDFILIDGPSVAAGVEPLTLGQMADAILLVVAADQTQKSALLTARNLLQKNGGRIAGVILNKVPAYLPAYYTTP